MLRYKRNIVTTTCYYYESGVDAKKILYENANYFTIDCKWRNIIVKTREVTLRSCQLLKKYA